MRDMKDDEVENYQLDEAVDYVIRRSRVIGFLRVNSPESEMSHSLDLLFVGSHLECEVRIDHAPLLDIVGILAEAETLLRRTSEKETLPWIAKISIGWPA